MPVPIARMLTIGLLPSALKVLYYRLRGAKIGAGVQLGLFSIIESDNIEIGDDCSIGPLTFITARKLVLKRRVKVNMLTAIDTGEVLIDDDSIVMEQVVIGGMLTPRSKISIGKRVKIFPYSFINPTEQIIIEDDVGIGGGNYIFTHGSWQSILEGFPVSFGPVTIKKGVWFPWRVFVMPNVTVGEYATIGAGSIITKDIPPRCLAAGSPAKVLKDAENYLKKYSKQEKINIIKNILNEFHDYIKYKYVKFEKNIKVEDIHGGSSLEIHYKDGRRIKFLECMESESTSCDALISFMALTHEQMKKLNAGKVIWFDIENSKTVNSKDLLWIDLKDFFSRYGIRFSIE